MESNASPDGDEESSSSFVAQCDGSSEAGKELNMNLFDTARPEQQEPAKHQQNDLVNQLETFRQQWHSELQNPDQISKTTEAEDLEQKATDYYLKGVELEENHMLMEAIYYYKKAIHLVPDIEMRLAPLFTNSPRDRIRQDSENSVEGNELEEDLVAHFENLDVEEKAICFPEYQQRATHISTLPVELVLYILQWVVSPCLDLRSLESFSQVCRGFFLCARDEQIWKIACDKIWDQKVGKAKKYGGSWRRMMIERAHPVFDGCYISQMTYVRQGEQNMDHFYRPCHVVQYYRYLRFFPDGCAMMLVSPEEPIQSLNKLKNINSRAAGLLVGGYKLVDSRVTCVMTRVKTDVPAVFRYKRQRRAAVQNETEVSYYLELEISAAQKRQNAKLTWMKYSTCTYYKSAGEELYNEFKLSKTSFPPLIFSHVTSYNTPSTQPLT